MIVPLRVVTAGLLRTRVCKTLSLFFHYQFSISTLAPLKLVPAAFNSVSVCTYFTISLALAENKTRIKIKINKFEEKKTIYLHFTALNRSIIFCESVSESISRLFLANWLSSRRILKEIMHIKMF